MRIEVFKPQIVISLGTTSCYCFLISKIITNV
jgi:hypothetical protein